MNTLINMDPWGILDDLFNVNSRTFRDMRARAAGRFPPVNVFYDDDAIIIDSTIYAAGTKGSVLEIDDETRLPKSISGNAVGLINPASIVKKNKCADDTTEMGKIFAMCGCLDDDPCGSETGAEATKVAASGTWSIKYNKSLSKGKKTLAKIVPSYAQKKSE